MAKEKESKKESTSKGGSSLAGAKREAMSPSCGGMVWSVSGHSPSPSLSDGKK